MAKPFPVGKIVGAFGLKGEVKVEPLTDFLERLQKGARLRLKDEWVTVEGFRLHKGRPLLKLSGIDDVDTAQALQWQILESTSEAVPVLAEDEFLTRDLIGLTVVAGENVLGKVDDVLALPAHDVLQVGTLLIPAVKQFVKNVDFDTSTITVELIPGMIEE
jgi:16S rRNA processing protein RimM